MMVQIDNWYSIFIRSPSKLHTCMSIYNKWHEIPFPFWILYAFTWYVHLNSPKLYRISLCMYLGFAIFLTRAWLFILQVKEEITRIKILNERLIGFDGAIVYVRNQKYMYMNNNIFLLYPQFITFKSQSENIQGNV